LIVAELKCPSYRNGAWQMQWPVTISHDRAFGRSLVTNVLELSTFQTWQNILQACTREQCALHPTD